MELPKYTEKGAIGKAQLAFNWLTNYGSRLPTKESIKTFKAIGGFTRIEPKNTLLYDFHSQGVVRHGDYMAKIRATPTAASVKKVTRRDVDVDAREEALRPLIVEEIREHDYQFDIQIQLCRNLKKQPIEEITTQWQESDTPFVTVARLTLPAKTYQMTVILRLWRIYPLPHFAVLKRTVLSETYNSRVSRPIKSPPRLAINSTTSSAVSQRV